MALTREQKQREFKSALRTFNKGFAGEYLRFVTEDRPEITYRKQVLRELISEQRAGNISPSEGGLTLERYREALRGRLPQDKPLIQPTREEKTFLGPTRPTTDIKKFRRTGISERIKEKSSSQSLKDAGLLGVQRRVSLGETGQRNYSLRELEKIEEKSKQKSQSVYDVSFVQKGLIRPINKVGDVIIKAGMKAEPTARKALNLAGDSGKLLAKVGEREAPQGSKRALKEFLLFSTFSPAFSQGMASQRTKSIYVYDQKKGVFVKKEDLLKYLRSPEKTGNTLNYNLKFKTKADRALTMLKNAKDPASRKLAIESIEQEYGKGFLKDLAEQEGLSLNVVKQVQKSAVDGKLLQSTDQISSQSSQVIATTSAQVRQSQATKQDIQSVTNVLTSTDQISSQDTKQTQKQRQVQNIFIDSLSDTAQDTAQDTKQTQRQVQNIIPKQITSQVTQSNLRSPTIEFKPPRQEPQRIPNPKIPLIKFLRTKKKEKSFNQKTKPLIDVFVRRFGQDIKVGTTKTKKKAESVLKSVLGTTLARSGFIEREGEKLDIDILGKTFRKSKKNNKRLVQKAVYSLGSVGEVKEIQMFKKKKSKSLFGF